MVIQRHRDCPHLGSGLSGRGKNFHCSALANGSQLILLSGLFGSSSELIRSASGAQL